MKKLLCLLLTLAMTLSIAACGSKADDKTPEEDDPTQAETPVDDKQDEPSADDADKDNASDATEIDPDANKGESLTRHKSPRNRPSPTARRTRRPQASRPNLLNLPSPPSPRKHRRKHLRRRTPARSHCSRLSGAHTARMTNFPPRAETQSTASTARPATSMCRTLTT